MNSNLKYWLAINQFAKIGPSSFKKLYNYFPTMAEVWQASYEDLLKCGWNPKLIEEFIIKRKEIEPDKELDKIQKENINVITIQSPEYPQLLKEIFNPPALLYIKGQIANLNNKFNIAVVGTRKISNYGKQITAEIVKPLVQNGITIVSGLALGVDSLAHQTCIENQGITIAVLGNGLDAESIYPSANRYLAQNILNNQGTIISEFPIGTLPLKHNFPTRNRIIAGLSMGTLVIEAGESSGALVTAYQALEQNREVFAVPGSLYNQNSIGTNKLIQKGAKLITGYQDILEELNLQEVKNFVSNNKILPATNEEKIILKILSQEPVHIDQIIKQSQLPANQIASSLVLMEMKGLIKNLGGQNYTILS